MPGTTTAPPMVKVLYDIVRLKGGLDQLTPTLDLPPSFCRDAANFECSVTGGYSRVDGYERFDGRAKPSDATYGVVRVQSFVNTPALNDTITGSISGATGTVIAVGVDYIVITKLVGTFQVSDTVTVGATTIGVCSALFTNLTPLLNAQYLNLAADVYRALIIAVPGSGPVRGVVSAIFAGVHKIYAFRNNTPGTSCVLHEATTSGWTAVPMFYEISFTGGGTGTPADGDTLSQSGDTALVKRVVLESGSWGAGNAAGRLLITVPTPGSFAAGAATIGAISVTLTTGNIFQVNFLPNGKFDFDIANFGGQLTTLKIYGADGVNRCFEFDGTVVVPIETNANVDTPKNIKKHSNHLIVSIGSSILGSGPSLPYEFTAAAGGFEIATGDTITAYLIQPGNQDTATLSVFCLNSSGMLYGTSVSNFKYVPFTSATGCIPYMAQNLEQSYVLDHRGLVNFRAAQEYGNFSQTTLTQKIQPLLSEKQSLSTYSVINKDKNQYRAFFSDGSAVYATIVNGKFVGIMPMAFPDAFFCAWNHELANGNDVTYAGGDDGFVYQLDRGSSFDGADIDAYLVLNWNVQKTPRTRKRYRRASIEVQSAAYASIRFGYALGYISDLILQPTSADYPLNHGGGGVWDESFWDDFIWDGRTLSPTEMQMNGTAENVQVTLSSTSDYIYSYTLNSQIIHYSFRRGLR